MYDWICINLQTSEIPLIRVTKSGHLKNLICLITYLLSFTKVGWLISWASSNKTISFPHYFISYFNQNLVLLCYWYSIILLQKICRPLQCTYQPLISFLPQMDLKEFVPILEFTYVFIPDHSIEKDNISLPSLS